MSLSNTYKPNWCPQKLWQYGKSIYEKLFTDYTYEVLVKTLAKGSSVVELGSGKRSTITNLSSFLKLRVAVDLYKPSLLENKRARYFEDYILADIRYLPFKNKSFEDVVALDVIEHLSKSDGLILIQQMENISNDKVVIMTPNGPSPKGYFEDYNSMQHHQSAWLDSDFIKLGFDVFGVNGARALRSEFAHATIRPRPIGEFASRITDRFVYKHPNSAFHLLCVRGLADSKKKRDFPNNYHKEFSKIHSFSSKPRQKDSRNFIKICLARFCLSRFLRQFN
jgi:SAM-dependent methyltransferase